MTTTIAASIPSIMQSLTSINNLQPPATPITFRELEAISGISSPRDAGNVGSFISTGGNVDTYV